MRRRGPLSLSPPAWPRGAGLDRLAGGTEVATGRRNVPLHVPVSRGPCDLCHRWSHSGDGEVAGEGGHGHAWAQRRGTARSDAGGALGCSRAAARLRPHVPILPSTKGYPRGPCPSPSPIPAPPGTLLGWRCLPGALRPPRTLPAVCFQFLLASAPPCFLPIKKNNKKKKIPGIFSACGSQRLERCRAPLCQAGAAWGGDGGCPWHLTSLFMPVYVGDRAGDCPATPPCPGLSLAVLSACLLHGWSLGPARLGGEGSSGVFGHPFPVERCPAWSFFPGERSGWRARGHVLQPGRVRGWCRQSRARLCPQSLTVSLSPVP